MFLCPRSVCVGGRGILGRELYLIKLHRTCSERVVLKHKLCCFCVRNWRTDTLTCLFIGVCLFLAINYDGFIMVCGTANQ